MRTEKPPISRRLFLSIRRWTLFYDRDQLGQRFMSRSMRVVSAEYLSISRSDLNRLPLVLETNALPDELLVCKHGTVRAQNFRHYTHKRKHPWNNNKTGVLS